MVRSPLATKSEELKAIPTYDLVLEEGEAKSIRIAHEDWTRELSAHFKLEQVAKVARRVFGDNFVDQETLENVMSLFVQAEFADTEESSVYVTNEKRILKSRLLLESHVSPLGLPLNIMSPQEASVLLDLFFKRRGLYRISNKVRTDDKWDWYSLSLESKVPHYRKGMNVMVDALAVRFRYALMALDEIGTQFYLGPGSDTVLSTLYHFGYLVSLVTGIFDNLALLTNTKLGINRCPPKVGLSGSRYKKLLKDVRKKSPEIGEHIAAYAPFMKLVYCLRNTIIHREGLARVGLDYKSKDAKWKANFIDISSYPRARDYLKSCGDSASEFDPFTRWGFYEIGGEIYLEPFHFSASVVSRLAEFVDEYLKLLSFRTRRRISSEEERRRFAMLLHFKDNHLGF
jgi:hypothetical protein